jgi:lipoprotein-releasing system permease protein
MINFSLFIVRKTSKAEQKSFSRVILNIAIVAIALSMTVMIIASSMVAGFKAAISEKMFGFWGHIHITREFAPSSYAFESSPLSLRQPYYPSLDTLGRIAFTRLEGEKTVEQRSQAGIAYIQTFANKAGIIKTKEQIEGIVLRGVGSDYHWSYLKKYMIEGDTLAPRLNNESPKDEILISETTAKRLKLQLGDEFPIYFVQGESSVARRFKIRGIFRTGLEEYDRRYALVDLGVVQSLNNWRPFRTYGPVLWLNQEGLALHGLSEGSADEEWAAVQQQLRSGQSLDLSQSEQPQALVSVQMAEQKGWKLGQTIRLSFQEEPEDSIVHFEMPIVGLFEGKSAKQIKTIYLPWQQLQKPNQWLSPQVSGFEIFVEQIADMDIFGEYLNGDLLAGENQYANTIRQREPAIFDWLNLTDINEKVLTILMILVAIINMTTALMILILERTNTIGLLKALGASNWAIRKVFLYHAGYLILRGLFFGNLIGLGFCFLQAHFQFITLPEELYYVSYAPIQINWIQILLLNLGTIVLTLVVLILPSWLVAKIDPVKAIGYK